MELVILSNVLVPLWVWQPISSSSHSRADNPPWTERARAPTGLEIKVMPSLSSALAVILNTVIDAQNVNSSTKQSCWANVRLWNIYVGKGISGHLAYIYHPFVTDLKLYNMMPTIVWGLPFNDICLWKIDLNQIPKPGLIYTRLYLQTSWSSATSSSLSQ